MFNVLLTLTLLQFLYFILSVLVELFEVVQRCPFADAVSAGAAVRPRTLQLGMSLSWRVYDE